MQKTAPYQLFQCTFSQSLNVHSFLAHKMHEFFEFSAVAGLVVAVQNFNNLTILVRLTFPDLCGLLTARTNSGDNLGRVIVAPVHIFLYLRNDHIPLADKQPTANGKLLVFNKGNIVQACVGYLAAFDNDGVHNCHRRTNAKPGGCPLNRTEPCLIQIVFKLECDPVLVMVSGASTGFRERNVIVSHNDSIDGNIVLLGILLKVLYTDLHLLSIQRSVSNIEFAHFKPKCREHPQFLGLVRDISETFKHIKRLKMQSPVFTFLRFKQPCRSSRKITGVFVRFTLTVYQCIL